MATLRNPMDQMARQLTGQRTAPIPTPMQSTAAGLRTPVSPTPPPAPPAPLPTAAFDDEVRARTRANPTPPGSAADAVRGAQPRPVVGSVRPSPVLRAGAKILGESTGRSSLVGPMPKPTVLQRLTPGARAGGLIAAGASLYNDAGSTMDVLRDDNATGIDKAAKVGSTLGRAGATGAGAGIGANVGMGLGMFAGPAAPLAVPALGLIGGAVGGWAGNKLATSIMPSDESQGQQESLRSPQTQASYSNEGRNHPLGRRPDGPMSTLNTDLQDSTSNASIQKANPGGQVQKVIGPDGRVTYSGANVSGDVSFTDAGGKALRGSPGGGFMIGGGFAPGEARAILDRPFDPRNAMNPAQRFQYDNEVAAARSENAFEAQRYAQNQLMNGRKPNRIERESLRRDATDRRNQDLNSQDNQRRDGVTMRGQDQQESESLRRERTETAKLEAPLRASRAMRERLQAYQTGPDGEPVDIARAMNRAMQNGDMDAAEAFEKMLKSQSAQADGTDKALNDTLAVYGRDDDGKPFLDPEATGARVRAVRDSVARGDVGTTGDVRKDRVAATAVADLRGSIDGNRSSSFLQSIGYDDPSATMSNLEELRGATPSRIPWYQAILNRNTQSGDRTLRNSSGKEFTVDETTFNDANVQELLKGLGVKLPKN